MWIPLEGPPRLPEATTQTSLLSQSNLPGLIKIADGSKQTPPNVVMVIRRTIASFGLKMDTRQGLQLRDQQNTCLEVLRPKPDKETGHLEFIDSTSEKLLSVGESAGGQRLHCNQRLLFPKINIPPETF